MKADRLIKEIIKVVKKVLEKAPPELSADIVDKGKYLGFIEKDRKARQKAQKEKKAAKEAKYGKGNASGKKIYHVKSEKPAAKVDDGIKRTGRIHVVSKKPATDENTTQE